MNKLLFLILFISLTSEASGQKIRLTDPNNRWVKSGGGTTICPYHRIITYGTDSIISGRNYKHWVEQIDILSTSGCYVTYPTENYYVREDTVAGIVYYRNLTITSIPDTAEHVYFNYNLVPGNTISYPGSIRDSVVYIDSTLINGKYHKIFYMGSNGTMDLYTFVEGIGSMKYPYVNFMDGCYTAYEDLICFSQGATNPVMNFPVYNCYVVPPDTFHNSLSCVAVSVDALDKSIPTITIFPNPATTQLTIKSTQPLNQIIITNLLGQTVYYCNTLMEEVKVNVSNLNAGLYLVKVNCTEVQNFTKQ